VLTPAIALACPGDYIGCAFDALASRGSGNADSRGSTPKRGFSQITRIKSPTRFSLMEGSVVMKRLLTTIVCALVVASFPQFVGAQETKTAQGTVTAVSGSSITIKVKDREMTFAVDDKTEFTARGASTKTRAAKAEGKSGPLLTDIVKVGQGVEVRYHEQGMHAASIRVLAGPTVGRTSEEGKQSGTGKAGAQTATGTVSAVTGTSLTIKGTAGEMTFVITDKTKAVGPGIGTAARKKEEAGEKTVITDFVATGDTVQVRYRDEAGTKTASEVRVTKKGAVKK
jgi:hypothetical protein